MRALISILALTSCGDPSTVPPTWSEIPALPEPTSNNAVAAVESVDGCVLVSASGIDASRQAAGIHTRAWLFDGAWQQLPDLGGPPRIAASAVTVRGKVYVVGGYGVAPDGAETTYANLEILDLETRTWQAGPPIPTPIDDAVVVAWRDRWIVVVSGWSNTAPVAAVQIFDVEDATWFSATPFPGTPVFGHAGAIVGDELAIVDGVRAGQLGFALEHQTWIARLDPSTPDAISWAQLPDHPGAARYRAAAGTIGDRLIVHGGTAEPYNFDGLTYTAGTPAPPLGDAIVFDPALGEWVAPPPDKPVATMDHRALVGCDAALHTIGGLEAGPAVTDAVWSLGS